MRTLKERMLDGSILDHTADKLLKMEDRRRAGTRKQMQQRKLLEMLAQTLTDEQAAAVPDLLPAFDPSAEYEPGTLLRVQREDGVQAARVAQNGTIEIAAPAERVIGGEVTQRVDRG